MKKTNKNKFKNNYKPQKLKIMAEETSEVKAEATPDMEAKKKQILALDSKKHVKIWLLHEVCLLKNKEIVTAMGTGNIGGVSNVLKDYNDHPEKMESARAFLK